MFGQPVRVIGPEDLVWAKLFVLDRERFDGADIAHVLRATATGSTGGTWWTAAAGTGACC